MAHANAFSKWLDTFITEKDFDLEEMLTAEGPSGTNHIPIGCLVEMMKRAPSHEQAGIKAMIVKIDLANGNVRHFFAHLCKAIAK